jgi:hypothetical protein
MLWLIGLIVWDCIRAPAVGRTVPVARNDRGDYRHSGRRLFEYNLGNSEVLMMFVSVVDLAYAALQNGKLWFP